MRLIQLSTDIGSIWINPDQILYIMKSAKGWEVYAEKNSTPTSITRITFINGESRLVQEMPEEINNIIIAEQTILAAGSRIDLYGATTIL